jgi:argonaute family protein
MTHPRGLNLNSYSSYRIFDTTDFTYVPLIGLTVTLSFRQAILATDGRRQYSKRPYIGTPNMLEVTMDKESTMDFKEFPRLVKQVYRFSYVNWRGFNARTIPVTINYPYLIARLVGNLEDVSKWNTIITNGKLIDKAWFL